jgi:hypothetical protein
MAVRASIQTLKPQAKICAKYFDVVISGRERAEMIESDRVVVLGSIYE